MFVTQLCGRCRQDLPLEAFNRLRDRRQYWCRECFRAYFRERGALHLAQVRASSEARRERLRNFLRDYLATHPCSDCGETDIVVLEFDHVHGKQRNVSELLAGGVPQEVFEAEIARCDVVCVNCHRWRTASRAGWSRIRGGNDALRSRPRVKRNITWVYEQLASARCTDCGLADPLVLEYDHVGTKRANVMALAWNECSLATIAAEIAQCEVRCCNCHRRKTTERAGWFRAQAG
jgi:hypothetical protein